MENPNIENSKVDLEKDELTEKIIGCAYKVANELGSGFLEKVYENALAIELAESGLRAEQQVPIQVTYRGKKVGDFFGDLLVEGTVLVELKAAKDLDDIFYAQCLNYLRATGKSVCLLMNFGKPELQVRRVSPRREWVK